MKCISNTLKIKCSITSKVQIPNFLQGTFTSCGLWKIFKDCSKSQGFIEKIIELLLHVKFFKGNALHS